MRQKKTTSSLLLAYLCALLLIVSGCTSGDDGNLPAANPNQGPQNNFNFIVQPGNGVVAGRVLDANGAPVAQAPVQFNGVAPRQVSARAFLIVTTTNQDGFFQFQSEPGGGTLDVAGYNDIPVSVEPGVLTQINLPGGMQGWIHLSQLSFLLDGTRTENTAWGQVQAHFPNPDGLEVMYFNMQVGDLWAIQNLPVQPTTLQPDSFFDVFTDLDLGVPAGQSVPQVSVFPFLSPEPLSSLPPVLFDCPVMRERLVLDSGLDGFPAELFPPAPQVGTRASGAALLPSYNRSDFNQDVGLNECVPGAASNSLKYLDANSTRDLSAVTAISTMKTATGWAAGGCGVDWAERKNKFMTDGNHPITTENTESFETALEAIKAGKDVELTGGWHAAMVVGIVKMENGNYSVQVAHDTKQGEAEGTKVETIIYNPTTKKFSGSPGFFDGSIFRFFTIEAVKPQPITVSPDISTSHQVGTSPCPQQIGPLAIANNTDGPLDITIESMNVCIETDGPKTLRLAPGDAALQNVLFNCLTQNSFQTVIQIKATDSRGNMFVYQMHIDLTITP